MAARPRDQPEPTYWSNAFKLWYGSYTDSKFRAGYVDYRHFVDAEVDSHDVKHDKAWPSTKRWKSRVYSNIYSDKYPRECLKEIYKYAKCKQSYGVYSRLEEVPQCDWAREYVMEGCPHWVLENMSLSKRFQRRAEKIDNITYKRAMEVSDYNK